MTPPYLGISLYILAQQMPQLTTWWVVIGEGVSPYGSTITLPPTTTSHVASCGICCTKICGTRLTPTCPPSPLHPSQLAMWRVMAFVVPKCVALDLLLYLGFKLPPNYQIIKKKKINKLITMEYETKIKHKNQQKMDLFLILKKRKRKRGMLTCKKSWVKSDCLRRCISKSQTESTLMITIHNRTEQSNSTRTSLLGSGFNRFLLSLHFLLLTRYHSLSLTKSSTRFCRQYVMYGTLSTWILLTFSSFILMLFWWF